MGDQHTPATIRIPPKHIHTQQVPNHSKCTITPILSRQFSADKTLKLNERFAPKHTLSDTKFIEQFKPIFLLLVATFDTRPQVANEVPEVEIIDRLDIQPEARIPRHFSFLLGMSEYEMTILSFKVQRMKPEKHVSSAREIQTFLPIDEQNVQTLLLEEGVDTVGCLVELLQFLLKLVRRGNALYRSAVTLVQTLYHHNEDEFCQKTFVELLAQYLYGEREAETLKEMEKFTSCCKKVKELCEVKQVNFVAFCRCALDIWLPVQTSAAKPNREVALERRVAFPVIQPHFSDLPGVLLDNVLSYVPAFDLIAHNRTSKAFHSRVCFSNTREPSFLERECIRRDNHNIGRAVHLIRYRLGRRPLFRKLAEQQHFSNGIRLWFLRYLLSYQQEPPVWPSMHFVDVVWMHLMGLFSISESYLSRLAMRRHLDWGDCDSRFRRGVIDLQRSLVSDLRLPKDILSQVTIDRMLAVTGRDMFEVTRPGFKDAEEWARNHGGALVRGMLGMQLFVSDEFTRQYGSME